MASMETSMAAPASSVAVVSCREWVDPGSPHPDRTLPRHSGASPHLHPPGRHRTASSRRPMPLTASCGVDRPPTLGLHGSAASTAGLLSSFAPSPTSPETFPPPVPELVAVVALPAVTSRSSFACLASL
ncbi:uncharacterized protein LOC125533903 [Triticum urartu]|uniref:uncharacterized protein LOC125533903 n=1 Tax=Triticum urartu TaxID=4572 RepID=UPI002043EBDD|nr:uncharacterized protein LOC125533903 [Triticum urartu]